MSWKPLFLPSQVLSIPDYALYHYQSDWLSLYIAHKTQPNLQKQVSIGVDSLHQHPDTKNKRKRNHSNTPTYTSFTARIRSPPIISPLLAQENISIQCHPTHKHQQRSFKHDIDVSKMLNFVPEDQDMEKESAALEAESGFVDEEEEFVVDGVERVFAQGTGGLVC
jgi:hypothetical protein